MLLLRIKQVNTMLFNFLLSFFRLYWHKVLSRRQTFICEIDVNWFNFLIFAKSHADCALYGRGWAVGQDIYKGVYYALVLTFWNPEKISSASQRQSNVNVPWVCYMHASLCRTAIGVSLCHWCLSVLWWLYTYRRGVRRCSFRQIGQFLRASEREASDSAGLHVFFMPTPS